MHVLVIFTNLINYGKALERKSDARTDFGARMELLAELPEEELKRIEPEYMERYHPAHQ